MSSRRRSPLSTLAAIVVALAVAGSGLVALVAPAAASPAAVMSAKVKCVNVKNGFARYSPSGACRKSERRDRKPCASGGSCVVGDTGPGRGKVYYSARTKQAWGRYLEVAPKTWNGTTGDLNLAWCSNVVDSIPGTQATAIGSGRANTAAMLTVCASDAAVTASGYRGGGKSDWYLPARDELRTLFLRQRIVGGFQLHGYWSSSESSPNEAWIQDFYSDYTPAPTDKAYANYVRPIRAF
jgi:hypothetical protein